ncbi:MAG TPA: dienelactone hydrolase family protein [Candidatus Limnocylindria bacterium]|nr:dienelactone hydrolase family protein [Candidatus Limnocylindria bacterium]
MGYDPFVRGPHAAGVRTAELVDAARERPLRLEIWYPAVAEHRGRDVDPETCDRYELLPGLPLVVQHAVRDAAPEPGRFPLVVFSHGYGGHRRQSTFLCTHLASHGYVVVAPDHTGNTIHEVFAQTIAARSGRPVPDVLETLREYVRHRPLDTSWTIDRVLDGAAGALADHVDAERVGIAGHSFGGWTTLATTAADTRIRAALPLAPAGGHLVQLPANPLAEALDLGWSRHVPTLYVVADRDSILPLPSMHDLFERTPAPKRMVVLRDTDHMHFCDRAAEAHEMFRAFPPPGFFESAARQIRPFAELCPAEPAYDAIRGLGLAHLDAALKGHSEAAEFLGGNVTEQLGARGIGAIVH